MQGWTWTDDDHVINALNKDQGYALKTLEDKQNFQDIKWKKAKL